MAEQRGTSAGWVWAAPWLAAGAVLLAHAGALSAGLFYDDEMMVARNPFVRDLANLGRLFGQGYFDSGELSWRPLATAVDLLAVGLFGLGPAELHALSLGLHAAGAALLAILLGRLGVGVRAATLAAAAFGVHPVLSETVLMVSYREDLLATLSILVGACGVAAPGAGLAAAVRLGVCTACAVAAKESGLVAPLLFALVALAAGPRAAWRDRLRRAAPALAVSLLVTGVYAVLRFGPLRNPYEAAVPRLPGGIGGLLATDAWLVGRYTALVAWPAGLSLDHVVPAPLPWPGVLWGVIALTAAAGGAWAARARAPLVAIGLAWTAVAFAPVANLVPLSVPLAERFLHLPLVGVALAFAAAGQACAARLAPARQPLVLVAGVAALVALAIRTQVRAQDFQDETRLWQATLAASPASSRALTNLGRLRANLGDLDAAIELHRRAVALEGYESASRMNLADCLQRRARAAREGLRDGSADIAEAETQVRAVIAMRDDHWPAWCTLGSLAGLRGDLAGQRAAYLRAAEVAPDRPEPLVLLARDRMHVGDPAGAMAVIAAARPAARDAPEVAALLAMAQARAGDLPAARRTVAEALGRWPDHTDLAAAAATLQPR